MIAPNQVAAEAREIIEAEGIDPTPIMPLIREEARNLPNLTAAELVQVVRAENGAAFKPRDTVVRTAPAERTLADMSEQEKIDFIGKNGLATYLALVDRQSELNRKAILKKHRGF